MSHLQVIRQHETWDGTKKTKENEINIQYGDLQDEKGNLQNEIPSCILVLVSFDQMSHLMYKISRSSELNRKPITINIMKATYFSAWTP